MPERIQIQALKYKSGFTNSILYYFGQDLMDILNTERTIGEADGGETKDQFMDVMTIRTVSYCPIYMFAEHW